MTVEGGRQGEATGAADDFGEVASADVGAFRFQTDASSLSMQVIELLANWRSVRFGMPYGDQALFMTAETFRETAGFPDMPLMEDFEFMRRFNPGGRVSIAPVSAVTSAPAISKAPHESSCQTTMLPLIAGFCWLPLR